MSLYDFVKRKFHEELISSIIAERDDEELEPISEKGQEIFLKKHESTIVKMINNVIQFCEEEGEDIYSSPNDLYRETIGEYGLYDLIQNEI